MKNKIDKKELCMFLVSTMTFIIASAAFVVFLIFQIDLGIYFSGVAILASLIATFVRPLLIKRKMGIVEIIDVVLSGIVFIILLIVYISTLPEPFLNVVTAVASTLMGGYFTLFGVGLTIKYSRIDKKEDEIKRAEPHIFPISKGTLISLINSSDIDYRYVFIKKWKTDLIKAKKDEPAYFINELYLSNSDLSMCVYHGLIINDHLMYFDNGQVIQKNSNVAIRHNIRFLIDEEIESVSLIFTDMLDNEYNLHAEFETAEVGKDKEIRLISIIGKELAEHK